MEKLAKSILTTVVYYDIFDFPLTTFEIHRYLMMPEEGGAASFLEIMRDLKNPELEKYLECHQGFYFLKGRRLLVRARIEKNKISQKKLKKILGLVRFLKYCPFVRMIAVTGGVAMKNARRKSDLDLLVAIKNGRMFTGRLIITLFAHLLGKRRHGRKIIDRACLNFFVSTDALEIDLKDIYSSSEYSFSLPVYGAETFRNFQEANLWIRRFRSNFGPETVHPLWMERNSAFLMKIKGAFEKILNIYPLEDKFKKWQIGRIARDPRTIKKDSGVMASSKALIFLPDPHGPKIYEKFEKKLSELPLDYLTDAR